MVGGKSTEAARTEEARAETMATICFAESHSDATLAIYSNVNHLPIRIFITPYLSCISDHLLIYRLKMTGSFKHFVMCC
jgi:hypothetical protein